MNYISAFILFSFISVQASVDYMQHAKSLVAGYATLYVTAYAHNLGHACAAKTLFNVPTRITVPILALWKSEIGLKGVLPNHGFKRAFFEVAGGVFALATMYASLKISSMVSEYSKEKPLLQTIKDGYNKPLLHAEQNKGVQVAVAAGILSELIHTVPLKCFNNGHGNDGYQFLKALKII